MLSRHPLAVACAAAFMLAANVGYAQDAAAPAAPTQTEAEAAKAKAEADKTATELETVQVVGIRTRHRDAIETKQTATSIVESISAEDIGKLPDILDRRIDRPPARPDRAARSAAAPPRSTSAACPATSPAPP